MIQESYHLESIGSNSTGIVYRLPGPDGMRGIVSSCVAVIETATTGPVGEISLGNAGDASAFGKIDIPNASINDRVGGFEPGYDNGHARQTNPDELILVDVTIATTLGALSLFITVDWE